MAVGMDFMGLLPWSQGNDYLLVIIDQLTSQVHLVPTTMRVMAKEVAWLFLKEVMRLHGVLESIVLNHDTKFTSMFWSELHRSWALNCSCPQHFIHRQMAQQNKQTAL